MGGGTWIADFGGHPMQGAVPIEGCFGGRCFQACQLWVQPVEPTLLIGAKYLTWLQNAPCSQRLENKANAKQLDFLLLYYASLKPIPFNWRNVAMETITSLITTGCD